MITFLLAGIAVIGAIAAAVFLKALLQAADGYEDETGFHQAAPSPVPGPTDTWIRLDAVPVSSPGEGI